ncbi:MAG: indole-3-glycerol phosphate synthase TrpC [Chloroflexi bacterium]|nr:indole-3-glycerol phosphate synthase TrpC [Chloroflexota bacterium]
MPTILDRIVEAKRKELAQSKQRAPLADLKTRIKGHPTHGEPVKPPLNFSGALWGESVRLIAEVKKASPSRGLLRPDFDPASLALSYAQSGAAAISVLTDAHFQGTLEHLAAVKAAVSPLGLPVLRKDFLFDSYQVYEARAYGADAILLIVAILTQNQLKELLTIARSLWVQCLVEVHTEEEMEKALEAGAEVIGINNRDLNTFATDLSVTERLAPKVPRGKIIVSESGVSARADVLRLQQYGVHAVLVGEALVTAPDVGLKVRELLGIIPSQSKAGGGP